MPATHDVLARLLDLAHGDHNGGSHGLRVHRYASHADEAAQRQLLRQILCQRHPTQRLPAKLIGEIDAVLTKWMSDRLLTRADTIEPCLTYEPRGTVSIWQGDVTTLANVCVIVNAANSAGLGCFQPSHRCIDNTIHAWAGPRLRDDCYALMSEIGRELKPGECLVTAGHCLPASHVVHVVGPQLVPGSSPEPRHEEQLARCYRSVLDAAEGLPTGTDGHKRVVFCGISTGLFAFPARRAAEIAVQTVAEWLKQHSQTTVTDIIFNTFTAADTEIYRDVLLSPPPAWQRRPSSLVAAPQVQPAFECASLVRARRWLESAEGVVVGAGAGLSASDGLDYTSKELFAREFPGFLKYGFRTLYSVFGFADWPTEQDRWGYYATHLGMIRSWPLSPMYHKLISWLEKLGPQAHIRTSNADGLFLANGWEAEKLSTPQGAYSVLQCMARCRPDSTEPSGPWLEAARKALDSKTQQLTDPKLVPRCRNCGGTMGICVRADHRFNQGPFLDGERRWKEFKARMDAQKKEVVILELGVGMSTPGVLRWPNEEWVQRSQGRVKLVRVSMDAEAAVPSSLEERGWAASVEGDIAAVIGQLFGETTVKR